MRITFKELLQYWPLKVTIPTNITYKKLFRNIDLEKPVAPSSKRR